MDASNLPAQLMPVNTRLERVGASESYKYQHITYALMHYAPPSLAQNDGFGNRAVLHPRSCFG